MADEVVLVQALHDQDDAAIALVVEAAAERVIVPIVQPSAGFPRGPHPASRGHQ